MSNFEIYELGNIKKNIYKAISLFSGCGGLDLGLEGGFSYLGKEYKKNPIDVIWVNEINDKASKTLKNNFPSTEIVCDDIKHNILKLNNGVIT